MVDTNSKILNELKYQLTIGLFGTCGGSTWRKPFMEKYNQLGISYFNPQVEDWKPELAEIEAQHLVQDGIILFPVTNETFGQGSLSEIGFSINSALKSLEGREIVILIDDEVSNDAVQCWIQSSLRKGIKGDLNAAGEAQRIESNKSRKLVKAHLSNVKHDNIHIVNTMEEMFDLSIRLFMAKYIKHVSNVTMLGTMLESIKSHYGFSS